MQQLHDHVQITDLVNRLSACLDRGRFDELGELVVDDATVSTPGGQAAGRPALIAQARRGHPADQAFQHVISNVLVDVHGDRAEARANAVVHITPAQVAPGRAQPPPPLCTIGGVYDFEVVRTPEGWRFSRIASVPLWATGTIPAPVPAA